MQTTPCSFICLKRQLQQCRYINSALQISRVQWPWFYLQLREIIRIFKINKKKEMFVNDSQKISKDKMRMWSTNMSKPEKPPENAFNYQTKRSWTPKVIKVSLFPSIDCPTGSKDQLPNSSSSSGEKETKRCLHLVSWTYSTPFCNIKSILWGSLTTSAAGIRLTINKQKMIKKTAKKENTGEHKNKNYKISRWAQRLRAEMRREGRGLPRLRLSTSSPASEFSRSLK